MKHLQCVVAFVGLGFALSAQSPVFDGIPQAERRGPQTWVHQAVADHQELPNAQHAIGKAEAVAIRNMVVTRQVVGQTTYDLQTNASMGQQLSGMAASVSAGWTMSFEANPFNDRGTGYNHHDGVDWAEAPEVKAESAKTGWTTIDRLGNGKDVTLGHSSPSTLGLHLATTEPGSGTFDNLVIPNEHAYEDGAPVGHLWPRVVVGGIDNESVHAICLSLPSYLGGAPYQGQEGAMLYYRSVDYGVTWEAVDLPGLDQTMFHGFEGDQYAIHARGAKVVIAIFNGLQDTVVLISDDNGDSWTTHTMVDFPVDMYFIDSGLPLDEAVDFDGDGVAQEFLSTDGGGDVHIDLEGTVHVVAGAMHYSDLDSIDQSYEFYPETNGLLYWRPDFGDDSVQVVGYARDLDGSGALELEEDLAFYGVNLAGMPCLASAEDGTLLMSYCGIMESMSTGTQNFRHIHLIHSTNHGDSWNSDAPCDLTPDLNDDGYECVFASMPDDVGMEVNLLFQRDFEPGVHIRGDQDPWGLNDMVHLRFDVEDLGDCEDLVIQDPASIWEHGVANAPVIFPNPATDWWSVSGMPSGQHVVTVRNALGQVLLEAQGIQNGDVLNMPEAWSGVLLVELQGGDWHAVQRIVAN